MNNKKTLRGTLKILIVSQHYPPEKSANAFRILDLATYLLRRGHDIIVLAPHPTYPFGEYKRTWSASQSNYENSIHVVNLWGWQPSPLNLNFISRMAYYLIFPLHASLWILKNHKKFDVIITSSPPIFVNFGGLISKLVFKKKWMLDARDLWIDAAIDLGFLKEGSFFEKISRYYEKVCFKKTNTILVVHENMKKQIYEKYKFPSTKEISVIPNGVDISIFYPREIKKKEQIIYAGHLGYAYDFESLILAFKKVLPFFNINLMMVGGGDAKNDLQEFVRQEGLSEYVEFTGTIPREEIPLKLSESLLGVAPIRDLKALDCAIPAKSYEYMACGLPIVGCGGTEFKKIIESAKCGYFVDNSPDSIADAILDLLNDPEKRRIFGENGIEFVKTKYNREELFGKINLEGY